MSLDEIKLHLKVEHSAEDSLIQATLAAARAHAESFLNRALVARTYDIYLEEFPCAYGDHYFTVIRLPFAPLREVASIKYYDSDNALLTLSTSVYNVHKVTGRITLAASQSWPSVYSRPSPIVIRIICGAVLPFTVDATSNVVTGKGGGLVDGDQVRLWNSGGALPAGLAVDTDYFARDIVGNTFKLAATSGGTAIDITGAGTGSHYAGVLAPDITAAIKLIAGELYKQRENSAMDAPAEIPISAQRLLWPHRRLNV